ncbi:hypothetical protein SAMN05444004_10435 [Jannaschia faecimaris]|uniref:Uncharacterized protein n=1 Tax=Jannaschia faecimaris TaxID=1244108 RepID=A0A1H3NMA6_9RHOB|nr:hypothetical protein [Jannaschia faecimaris]SDY90031.1 hypothetical protein SAMN05444004_10435 [Jannaschia faecimaris]
MSSFSYDITGGDVTVRVIITEMDGGLTFDLEVLGDSGTIGDLNALYLDILDDDLTEGLSVTGTDVTAFEFDADAVTKVDNFTTIKGEVLKEFGAFDMGVQFGTQGIGDDDIQSTSFFLSHETETLEIEDFLMQDSAVRLTSVGEIDGERDGSLKIGGIAEPISEPEPEGPILEEPPIEEEGPTVGEDIIIVEEIPLEDEFVFLSDPINGEGLGGEMILDVSVEEEIGAMIEAEQPLYGGETIIVAPIEDPSGEWITT